MAANRKEPGLIPRQRGNDMARSFEYEWWTVEVQEATGKYKWEVKAKNRSNAEKQILKWAKEHDEEVNRVRPDFKTTIYWDTMVLDRKGYQRLF